MRHISTQTDQISTVRTALGIATIIQVPARPTSVVIGDQSAFKVEYLDRAVTIKPLIPNAKTNIYIYTDWQRYNIKLISTSKEQADYVVYPELTLGIPPPTEMSQSCAGEKRVLRFNCLKSR